MNSKKVLIVLVATLATVATFAATSYTTYFNLAKPGDGDNNWGSGYRDNLDTIDTQLHVSDSGLSDHIADTVGAHAATAISTDPGADTCTLADDVQEYLDCLDAQVAGLSGGSGVFLLSDNNTASGNNTFTGTTTFSNTLTSSAGVMLTGIGGTGVCHSDSGGNISSSPVVLTSATEVSGILPIANGGTNSTATATAGGVGYGTGTAHAYTSAGSTGQILQSAGAGTPTFSTATYPSTAGTSGTHLTSNGTNIVNTTATYPSTAGTSGTLLTSNGTNIVNTTATYPSTAGTSGTILRSNGTNVVNTTATYPTTTTANQILYSSATNTISEITTAATSALVTNSSSVPAFTSGSTGNRLLRTDGTTISFAQAVLTTDVSGTLPIANGGTNGTATPTNGGVAYGTGTAYAFSAAGTTGQVLQSAGAATPTWVTDTVIVSAHSATATVTSTPSDVSWTTEDQDNTASFGGVTFTVPSGAGGTYSIDASIRMTATTIAVDNTFTLSVLKNGAIVATHFVGSGAITQSKFIPHTFWQGALVATDTIKIQISSDATSPSVVASTVSNLLAIRRVGN